MSDTLRVDAFSIVPSNDLVTAIPFWVRLGFTRTGDDVNYTSMTGWEYKVHLIQARASSCSVPEENNPIDVFIRTPDVDAIANGASTRLGYAARTGCLMVRSSSLQFTPNCR